MKHLSLVTLIFLVSAVSASCQNAAVLLRDGQQLKLSGPLVMESAGRLQFATVRTIQAYQPVFKGEHGSEAQGEVLHGVGVAGYSDYALLYAHRGQQVTVTGKIATDDATPYFWHGTRLQAASIRLADGTDLLHPHEPPLELIAADVGTYQATVTLPSDLAAPWMYSTNGQPARKGHFLSCSSNGGGDVVNCFCAQGFRALQVESARKGVHEKRDVILEGMAQVEVGEEAVPPVVRIMVTCSR